MEFVFFNLAFAAYTIGMILYVVYTLVRKEVLPQTAKGVLLTAVVLHAISLAIRTYYAHQLPQHQWYVPWSNWFESFSFFTFVITIVFLAIQAYKPLPILGVFISPLAWGSMIGAVISPFGRDIPQLQPALQSYWMAIHVPVMFVSYSLFANAFGIGLAYLLQERFLKAKKPVMAIFRLPALDELDNLIYKIIAFAFPVLTLGVLLGAAWAYEAWGRYWGWDPKETWAFITWVVYAIYLHLRLVSGWRGKKSAYLSLAGFGVVLFTYIGVNFISDLHGFLSGGGK
ncbi:c-type cytochrome biogenesis protein CcsB [bacterium F11]|nr:c-type cytochrome biogenesis protein CcsB [bacterium F11]